MVLAAVAKLGFIADLISKPTMIGYMNGLALTILVGQLPKLFGFKVDADGLIGELAGFVKGLANGEAVAGRGRGRASPGSCVILVLQRWLPKVPAVLVMVVLAIAATTVFSLADHGVSLVGVLPQGLPAAHHPARPLVRPRAAVRPGRWGSRWCRWPTRSRPRRRSPRAPGRRSHGNQEMIGIGAANLAAGPVPGLPGEHQRLADGGGRTVRRRRRSSPASPAPR